MDRIYLDWAATAVPDENILEKAFIQSIRNFGNPSSPHQSGKNASELVVERRKALSKLFGCQPGQIFFTGSGTEANNIVLTSLMNKKRKGNIVISGIEHSAVYEPAMMLQKHGWEIRTVNPESCGILSAERFCGSVDDDTRLAAVMMVNNETGAIQPVDAIGRQLSAEKRRLHFHIDAVQAAGKIPLSLNRLPVDSASISSHKFRGPRGFGLLYLKNTIEPVYRGGGQEEGIRSGTENTYGIAATAAAAESAIAKLDENLQHALELKKILIDRIPTVRGVKLIPCIDTAALLNPELFSPYILSVSVQPAPGEILVRVLSDRGFDIATGSACATGRKKRSRVMDAMGINPEAAFSTVRISTGPTTTIDEITRFCDTFERESTILIKQLSR